eukprot:57214-Rhodomonas_salina.1
MQQNPLLCRPTFFSRHLSTLGLDPWHNELPTCFELPEGCTAEKNVRKMFRGDSLSEMRALLFGISNVMSMVRQDAMVLWDQMQLQKNMYVTRGSSKRCWCSEFLPDSEACFHVSIDTPYVSCPEAGTYWNKSSCAECEAGSFSLGYATRCLLCPEGSFNTLSGLSSCMACEPGTFSGPGSQSCIGCDESGEGWDGVACAPCAAGTFSGGNGLCLDCPAGSFSEVVGSGSADSCEACTNGSYSIAGATQCTECWASGMHWDGSACSDIVECDVSGTSEDGNGGCVCAGGTIANPSGGCCDDPDSDGVCGCGAGTIEDGSGSCCDDPDSDGSCGCAAGTTTDGAGGCVCAGGTIANPSGGCCHDPDSDGICGCGAGTTEDGDGGCCDDPDGIGSCGCADGIENGEETAVDCGGPSCADCCGNG